MIEVNEQVYAPAAPQTVWELLSHPEAVVECVPGASLGEHHEDGTFDAGIVVKFGPAKVTFKARVGLEAVSLDIGGWDSHITQSAIMDPQMRKLNTGLSAFHRDLGKQMQHVTVVVLTEFGRRLAENSAFGTDHGRGSVMFVMGGGVKGGRVVGRSDEIGAYPAERPVNPGEIVATIYKSLGLDLLAFAPCNSE